MFFERTNYKLIDIDDFIQENPDYTEDIPNQLSKLDRDKQRIYILAKALVTKIFALNLGFTISINDISFALLNDSSASDNNIFQEYAVGKLSYQDGKIFFKQSESITVTARFSQTTEDKIMWLYQILLDELDEKIDPIAYFKQKPSIEITILV